MSHELVEDEEEEDLMGFREEQELEVEAEKEAEALAKQISTLIGGASSSHPKCKKCALNSNCKSPYQVPYWWLDGPKPAWTSHIPDEVDLKDRSWIIVVGDPPDVRSDITSNMLQAPQLRMLENVIPDGARDAELPPTVGSWGMAYLPATRCRPPLDIKFVERAQERAAQEGQEYTAEELLMHPEAKAQNPDKTMMNRCFGTFLKPIMDILPNVIGVVAKGSSAAYLVVKHAHAPSTVDRAYSYSLQDDSKTVPAGVLQDTTYVLTDTALRWPEFVKSTRKITGRIFVDVAKRLTSELPPGFEYVLGTTAKLVEEWFRPVLANPTHLLSWDVETSGVQPYALGFKVGVFAFHHEANDKPLIVCTTDYDFMPQLLDSSGMFGAATRALAEWQKTEEPKILRMLKLILEAPTVLKLGHNLQFDEVSVRARFGWEVKGFAYDTMMQEYLIDPDIRGLRGLDDLCRKYLPDIPQYWEKLQKYHEARGKKSSYLSIPPEILLPYAAYDAYVTFLLHEKTQEALANHPASRKGGCFVRPGDDGTLAAWTYNPKQYCKYVRKVHHRVCCEVQGYGQYVNLELAARVYKVYHADLVKKQADLADDEDVRAFELGTLPAMLKLNHPQVRAFRKDPDGCPLRINWASILQVRALFIGFLGLPVIKKTEKGAPCLDEGVIKEYALSNPVAKKLLLWRSTAKFITSFLNPLLTNDPAKSVLQRDKMVHSQFAASKIATGRLSSSRPNMQAIPRDGEVKRIYTSRHEKGWILTRDYSGIEVRVLAMVSRDPILRAVYLPGGTGDAHFATQQKFFGERADKKNKTQRSICKQALFGQIYGQGDKGLFELLTLNGVMDPDTGAPITYQQCQDFNRMLAELYTGVQDWVKASHNYSIQNHYVTSAFGFVRNLPVLKSWEQYIAATQTPNRGRTYRQKRLMMETKEALRVSQNASIQSTASDFTVLAADKIIDEFKSSRISARLYNIVHDDIWSDIEHAKDVPMAVQIMGDSMDRIAEWLPKRLPGFDTSWMDIPVIGEAEIGLSPKDCFAIVEEPSAFDPSKRLKIKVGVDIAKDALGSAWNEGQETVEWSEGVAEVLRFHLQTKQLSLKA
jgi:DNA polymerase I-like protein with 3'-5' exonuclease and polymerase domains